MDENKIAFEVQNQISAIVPQMISDALGVHNHTGGDSPQLSGDSISGAPATPLTTATSGSLSSGGSGLTSGDNAILTNALTRIAELENRLRSLNLLS